MGLEGGVAQGGDKCRSESGVNCIMGAVTRGEVGFRRSIAAADWRPDARYLSHFGEVEQRSPRPQSSPPHAPAYQPLTHINIYRGWFVFQRDGQCSSVGMMFDVDPGVCSGVFSQGMNKPWTLALTYSRET